MQKIPDHPEFEDDDDALSLTDSSDNEGEKIDDGSVGTNSTTTFQAVYQPTTMALTYERKKGLKKYRSTLKHCFPFRLNRSATKIIPVDRAGCWSFSTFSWLTPLAWKSFRHGLKMHDLYQISPLDGCQMNGARFSTLWEQEVKKSGITSAKLQTVVVKFVMTRLLFCCLFYSLCLLFGFLSSMVFLPNLVDYVDKPEPELVDGIIAIVALIICEFLRLFFFSLMWAVNTRTAVRTSSGLMALLYRKLLRVRSLEGKSAGEIVNLFSNDIQKIFMMIYTGPLITGVPFVLAATIAFTYHLIGSYCFVGIGVFVLACFIEFGLMKVNTVFRKKAMVYTDKRVSLMSELLNCIKMVKMYAWEKLFASKVEEFRRREKCRLMICQYLQTLGNSVALMIPILTTIFTILVYTMNDNSLTPAEAFTLLMVFTVASHSVRVLPLSLREISNGRVAMKRLSEFLKYEDKENYSSYARNANLDLSLNNACFSWSTSNRDSKSEVGEINIIITDHDKTPSGDISTRAALVESSHPLTNFILKDITFLPPKGSLTGLCGPVGSGKSSLLLAILGRMHLVSGQLSVTSSCAYVPQEPWLFFGSAIENIQNGAPLNNKKYYKTLYCCGLTEDFAALRSGDQTFVGDKGITLSGGQKQRINLARAMYADRELYLLDDPLSAVDQNLGQRVFQHCIKGALKGKTILLVTNQSQYLQQCDNIIVMRDGQIVEQGSHEELYEKQPEYTALVKTMNQSENKELPESPTAVNKTDSPGDELPESPLGQSFDYPTKFPNDFNEKVPEVCIIDTTPTGSLSWDIYSSYIGAAGGYCVCISVMLWYLLQAALASFANWWLSHWISAGSGLHNSTFNESNGSVHIENIIENPDLHTYQLVYGTSAGVMLIITLLTGFLFAKTSLRASSRLHNELFSSTVRSPMSFFDTIPIGRILNIFTRDFDEIDVMLPSQLDNYLQNGWLLLFYLLLVAMIYPWFVLFLALIALVFIIIQRMFRIMMRDLKRQECATRTPVFSHVTSSVQGLSSIYAFQKQESSFEKFSYLVDTNASPMHLYYSSMRWLAFNLGMLCIFITLAVSCFAIAFKDVPGSTAAFAGLCIAITMQLSGILQFVVRSGCELESRFTSVERIQSAIANSESEPSALEIHRPGNDWPSRGRISFRNVNLKYRPDLPFVLKDLSFDIGPREKIGVIGRTGSGKTSIVNALFRLVELHSGSITIDGVNIATIGLHDLRSKLAIIPQEAVLFSGTIRENLDPFNLYSDEELWDILEKTHMKDKVACLSRQLSENVSTEGEKLSLGEKQLLCIARCLLRHCKILILDEATATVDSETDKLIHETVHELFPDSTVFIIAHRITSLAKCNRIMVVTDGKVTELDHLTNLFSSPENAS